MNSNQKKIALILIYCMIFIDWMGIGLVYPMFSSMIYQKDSLLLPHDTLETVKGTVLGILIAITPFVSFFFSPVFGTLSDMKGRRGILIWCLSLGVVGYLIGCFGVFSQSLAILILSRVLVGVSCANSSVIGAALVDVSVPEEKARNFSYFNMACGIGFMVGPFIGGKLSESFLFWDGGYHVPFLFAGVVTLINLILVLFLFKETNFSKRDQKIDFLQGILNIRQAFQSREMKLLFCSILLFSFGWCFYWEFISVTWIDQFQFTASEIGNVYAYGAIFYSLSSGFLVPALSKRMRPEKLLLMGLILSGIAIFSNELNRTGDELWWIIPFQQTCISLLFPTAAALVSNMAGEKNQGEYLGIFYSIESFGFGFSPLISGFLLGFYVKMPIVAGGGAMIFAAGCLYLFLKQGAKAPKLEALELQ